MSLWVIERGYPHEGETIKLLSLPQLRSIQQQAPDAELVSIFGEKVKARDCDDDTRFGRVAYGQLIGLGGLAAEVSHA